MNASKEKILKIAADLMLGQEARPGSGSLDDIKSLAQRIAFVLETRAGRNPLRVVGCRLKDEDRDIYPEVVWNLFCARVIVPASEGGGLDRIRPQSDAAANWHKFKAVAGISG
ncbi:MAG TPA: hypothetical protein VMJ12_06965 [Candidatus Acidoferrales bacterium]|nr:hypothetical protein [Candidatus Acidoferrales bacterium]